jgi:hypothetical protein
MAWRHGHGKPGTPGHDHYVNRRNKGLKEAYDDNSTKVSDWSDKKLKFHSSDDRKHSSSHVPAWSELRRRAKTSAPAPKKTNEEVEQIDELSTDTYHSAAKKAAKRAMGDVQGRSGPIFKKYAGMANKFRDKGMDQEKKEKSMKEATDPRDSRPQTYRPNDTTPYSRDRLATRMTSDPKDSKARKAGKLLGLKSSIKDALGKHGPKGKLPEETDPGFVSEAENAVAKQIAAKKDAVKADIQKKIAAKQTSVLQAKANKRLSNIHASNDKCSCSEGKGKSMTCEVHGDTKKMKGGKEPIEINPPMREAAELPKKVITKGHEIAKSLIKHRSGVDNPYAVGMAQAKKSAKMNAYRTDRDKNKED